MFSSELDPISKIMGKNESLRIPIIFGFIGAILVFFGMGARGDDQIGRVLSIALVTLGFCVVTFAVVMLSVLFLRENKIVSPPSDPNLVKKPYEFRTLSESSIIKSLEDRLLKIESRGVAQDQLAIDDAEIVEKVASKVHLYLTDDLIDKAADRLSEKITESKGADAVKFAFMSTTERLTREADRTWQASRYNLAIGGGISFAGIILLVVFLFWERPLGKSSSLVELLVHYGPRFSLVLLVESLAIFFLNLYKASAEDMKYYHNELTNVEQKRAAYAMSATIKDEIALASVIEKSASVERNFILKKDETTIYIEKARIESASGAAETLKSIIPTIIKLSGKS